MPGRGRGGGRGWGPGRGQGWQQRHSPVTVSLLEPALLILLQAQPGHGYTLLTELEDLGMGTIHPSVVYRALRDMESLEWVVSDWDTEQTQGPPRRMYRLAPLGEEALSVWARELDQTRSMITQLLSRIHPTEKSINEGE